MNAVLTNSRVLVVAPHTDDAELGCGASISRFLRNGQQVAVQVFSTAEASLPANSTRGRLLVEFHTAMDSMGLDRSHRFVHDLPVRRLGEHRQTILDLLLETKRTFAPDLILCPSSCDVHQDHQVVYWETLRAFKELSVWGYELPWNQISSLSNAFVIATHADVQRKAEALACYASQVELNRPYFAADYVFSLARVRGIQVKAEYAESFEVLRLRV